MSEGRTKPQVSMTVTVMDSFNYALHFNHYSLIRDIRIQNKNAVPVSGLELDISSDLPFFEPVNFRLPEIPEKYTADLGAADLQIKADFLAGLTEAANAVLTVELKYEDEVLTSFQKEVMVLSYDQSAFCSNYP